MSLRLKDIITQYFDTTYRKTSWGPEKAYKCRLCGEVIPLPSLTIGKYTDHDGDVHSEVGWADGRPWHLIVKHNIDLPYGRITYVKPKTKEEMMQEQVEKYKHSKEWIRFFDYVYSVADMDLALLQYFNLDSRNFNEKVRSYTERYGNKEGLIRFMNELKAKYSIEYQIKEAIDEIDDPHTVEYTILLRFS